LVVAEPEFTLGIEEEYFFVDRATRDVVDDLPPAMLTDCEALLAGQANPELLRSRVEVDRSLCQQLV
jgi:glutamate---cysteine ligase / carboxylate-amine ligase